MNSNILSVFFSFALLCMDGASQEKPIPRGPPTPTPPEAIVTLHVAADPSRDTRNGGEVSWVDYGAKIGYRIPRSWQQIWRPELSLKYFAFDAKLPSLAARAAGPGEIAAYRSALSLSLLQIWRSGYAMFVRGETSVFAQEDARWEDAIATSLITSVSYRFTPRFEGGVALLVQNYIGDDLDVLMVPTIKARLSDQVVLKTEAGIHLDYTPSATPANTWSLGFSWSNDRLRLARDAPEPNAILQHRRRPVWVGFERTLDERTKLSFRTGLSFEDEFELRTPSGRLMEKERTDTGTFFDVRFTHSF